MGNALDGLDLKNMPPDRVCGRVVGIGRPLLPCPCLLAPYPVLLYSPTFPVPLPLPRLLCPYPSPKVNSIIYALHAGHGVPPGACL